MVMHARQLTHDELISLTQLANGSDAFSRNRASVILLSAKGKCVAEIADTVGRSQRHVRNLIHSFNANGLQAMCKGSKCLFRHWAHVKSTESGSNLGGLHDGWSSPV